MLPFDHEQHQMQALPKKFPEQGQQSEQSRTYQKMCTLTLHHPQVQIRSKLIQESCSMAEFA